MILVVDGNALTFQSFFASAPKEIGRCKTEEERKPYYDTLKKTKNGIYTNAIEVFFKYLIGLISNKELHIEQVVVCFDKSRQTTFRKKIYPDYKEQRPSKPVPLTEQFCTIKKMLSDVGIRCYEHDLYEADDIAGSIAKHFEEEGVLVLTKDKDYLQLVSDNIHVLMLRSGKDAEFLAEKYGEHLKVNSKVFDFTKDVVKGECGVYPFQITSWKAVSGDPSDNIPGVKGVSDRTILPLLEEYGTIVDVYKEMERAIQRGEYDALLKDLSQKFKVREKYLRILWDKRKDAALFYKLTTINTKIPVKSDLHIFDVSNIDFSKLDQILMELELFELAKNVADRFE